MKRPLVLLLGCLLVAGCGSTVQQADRSSAMVGTRGESNGSEDPSLGSTDALTTDAVAGAAAAPGAATGARAAGRTSTEAQHKTAAAVGARGGTVRIGVRYPANSSGLVATAGFTGIDPGDSRAMAQTVVDDINARGGIAGRKVDPVYHPFDVTASTAPGGSDNEQQKACAAFTEDTTVFAVVSPIVGGTVLYSCLASHGVVFIDENWNYIDMAKAGPGYWTPAYPDAQRSVPALVRRLWENGFLAAGAKVGAVYQDLPNRKPVVDRALAGALARYGLKIDGRVAWTPEGAQALAAGVLRFRSMGITHVFVLDPGGLETFGWMAEAEAQSYRPKYAIDTRNYPFLQQSQSPAGQLANARGIGWVPSADVGVQPDAELTAADRRCLAVVAKSGQDLNDATNVRVAMAYCDTFEFLKTAAGDASTVLSLASVRSGGEALADAFIPTGTFRTHFGPGRHDGASAARDLAFDTACTCFRYTGPVFPID
jgi:hypothetical protein